MVYFLTSTATNRCLAFPLTFLASVRCILESLVLLPATLHSRPDPVLPVSQEAKREERKKLADEDAIRKIRQLEEHNHVLQKQIHNQKQVLSTTHSQGY